jgi:hypothetical protein
MHISFHDVYMVLFRLAQCSPPVKNGYMNPAGQSASRALIEPEVEGDVNMSEECARSDQQLAVTVKGSAIEGQ